MRSKMNNADTLNYLPEKYRCRFTSRRGLRCNNRLLNSADGLCLNHAHIVSKLDEANATAVVEKLVATTPFLETREEVRASMAQLYLLVAQKRVKRSEGALLAYIGSLVLQGLPPRESGETDTEASDAERAEEVRQAVEDMFAPKN